MLKIAFVATMILIAGPISAADLAAGEKLYKQSCVACHGAAGESNDALGAPALAGQSAVYLVRQLEHFSNGIRGGATGDTFGSQMMPMANLLATETDRKNVAAYLQSLERGSIAPSNGDVTNGYKHYQASCGACHGGKAQGNEALNAPMLAGQSPAYLKRQYQYFLADIRGAHKEDKYGMQMKMIANTLTDEKKIDDVIAFIAMQ